MVTNIRLNKWLENILTVKRYTFMIMSELNHELDMTQDIITK